MEAWSLNHGTTREVPGFKDFFDGVTDMVTLRWKNGFLCYLKLQTRGYRACPGGLGDSKLEL